MLKVQGPISRQFGSLFYPKIGHLGERWMILTKHQDLFPPYHSKTPVKLTENVYNLAFKKWRRERNLFFFYFFYLYFIAPLGFPGRIRGVDPGAH